MCESAPLRSTQDRASVDGRSGSIPLRWCSSVPAMESKKADGSLGATVSSVAKSSR